MEEAYSSNVNCLLLQSTVQDEEGRNMFFRKFDFQRQSHKLSQTRKNATWKYTSQKIPSLHETLCKAFESINVA